MALISGNDKLVLPGLWDAHCHAYAVGHMAKVADLSHSTSIEDMQERLRKKLSDMNNEVSTYLEGVQWDQEEMGRYPNRFDLDSVTKDFPIITYREGILNDHVTLNIDIFKDREFLRFQNLSIF